MKRKSYIHNKHTGRMVAHKHTNYGSLFGFIIFAGVLLMGTTSVVMANDDHSYEPHSMSLRAVVPAGVPKRPAQILQPLDGQNFSTNAVEVIGNCLPTTLVRIYNNNILSGAVFCTPEGSFRLIISLFSGANILVARSSDALGQEAPPSVPVTVYFNNTLTNPQGGSSDIILRVDQQYQGYEVGQETSWPVGISGGVPPYAINIDWGDGKNEVVSQTAPGIVNFKHTYSKGGTGARGDYAITISASDKSGHTRRIQLTVIINEHSKGVAPLFATPSGRLQLAWPIWIVLLLMVGSFWLGERHEKKILRVR